ncbi:hypothetical protein [Neoaquamicrobium sediminum]|uniref:hypothetical protein n=1 Tax=Neoaquamicrobium sediminum TaxID=1849104 RepID=UPI003BAB61A5
MSAPTVLAALCDTLVPGDDTYPAASAAGVVEASREHARFAATLDDLAARLPEDFAALGEAERVAELERLEVSQEALFSAAVVAVYSLYYTRQPVLDAIEKTNGYSARPPQPQGHALPPFDPAIVAVQAARAPHYRPTPARNPNAGGSDAH